MASPAISHLICTSAVVILIFVMPFYYNIVVDNIRTDMVQKELREIADYVSNTIANLYFLVNSTELTEISLQKDLIYLPSSVENFIYVVEIKKSIDESLAVTVYLRDRPSVVAEAWLLPGPEIYASKSRIESSVRKVSVGCLRSNTGIYVWIGCSEFG